MQILQRNCRLNSVLGEERTQNVNESMANDNDVCQRGLSWTVTLHTLLQIYLTIHTQLRRFEAPSQPLGPTSILVFPHYYYNISITTVPFF